MSQTPNKSNPDDALKGWYQVAFEREIAADISPAKVGSKQLIVVRSSGNTFVLDAHCPHRGAHLAYGGKVDGDKITCPFHNLKICFDTDEGCPLSLRSYDSLVVGGLVFVRLSKNFEMGFRKRITAHASEFHLFPGYIETIQAPSELVIENGFDPAHFSPVHNVKSSIAECALDSDGAIGLSGNLFPPRSIQVGGVVVKTKQHAGANIPFKLTAFSPGLSVLQMEGSFPYLMIIGATPITRKNCLLYVSVGLSRSFYGDSPDMRVVNHLIEQSKSGINDDRVIWENLREGNSQYLHEIDDYVMAFRRFCRAFDA